MRMFSAWTGRGRHAGWIALLAIVAGGCQGEDAVSPDQPIASRTEESEVLSAGQDRLRTPTGSMAVRKWAEITISARSALKPNSPISLAVAYSAVYATSSADLRVILPEVESARRTGWGDGYGTQSGSRLAAVAQTSRAFSAGERLEEPVAFTVEAAGIYRLHVAALASGIDWSEVRERVQPAAHEEVWLLVNDSGGRVLPAFDPATVPEGFLKRTGPFRKTRRAISDGSRQAARSASCSWRTACLFLQYYDRDTEAFEIVPNFKFEFRHIDEWTGRVVYRGEGYSDETGTFILDCPYHGSEITGFVSLDSNAVTILTNGTGGYFAISSGDCGDERQITFGNSTSARTWVVAQHAISNSRTTFGTRSKVDVELNVRHQECVFLYWRNTVHLVDDRDHDCVWGQFGLFAFAHEYGHAVHHAMGGGLVPLAEGECEHHEPGMELETLGCAYNEGFANYHGWHTRPTLYALGEHPDYSTAVFENNPHLKNEMDGSRDVGPVMSFFYDLFDAGSNESHDRLALTETSVLSVMGRCRVRQGGTWGSPTGIDHLIWCLESRVDGVVGAANFKSRNPQPTAQNQGSHDWPPDDVRTLWLADLFAKDG